MTVKPRDQITQMVDEIRLIHEELEAQTDRGVAIIGGVAIETRLEGLIKTALVPGEDLPGTRTAAGKRETAYALGLISKAERTEIKNLFEVRNKFAHSLTATTFEADVVRPLCAKLTFAEKFYLDHKWSDFLNDQYNSASWKVGEPLILPRDFVYYPYGDDPRKRYEWTVLALIEMLAVRTWVDAARIPQVPEDFASPEDINKLRWTGSAVVLKGIRERLGDEYADALSKGRDELMVFNAFHRESVAASRRYYEQMDEQAREQWQEPERNL